MRRTDPENSPKERGSAGRGDPATPPPWEADGIRSKRREGSHAEAVKTERNDPRERMTMEAVLSPENLNAALRRVVSNKGAPGVDAMTVGELEGHLKENWERIADWLLSDRYRPKPVRKVEIEKPGGGIRVLGIPTVLDRFIQQALLQVMQPCFDPHFSEHSYGFRPGRSAAQAVQAARGHIEEGKRWVVDMDLEKFFDRVNHDVLMVRLWRHIADKRILHLIRRYLQAGMMEGGLASPRSEGTPQGGPLSPLLSNILLDDLDKELERRGHRFVRYADDCNIYVASREAGERVLDSIEKFLEKDLRLKVNRAKSAVDRPWSRKFLGYSVTASREPKLRVAAESVRKLKKNVKEILRKGRGRSVKRTIADLNPKLRGWMVYFRHTQCPSILPEIDSWLRRRLRCIVWRQWKRPKTRRRKLRQLGLSLERARTSAGNGRGPWYNAGSQAMNHALPINWFDRLGLINLHACHRRLFESS